MSVYIPNKLCVGYNERSDTYTGKLAYVIYYDEKGILRKEKSWNNWRNDDRERKSRIYSGEFTPIPSDNYDNEPISGFVLNKKVGDYSGDWGNHRSAYCRVYDPRGFEVEITIQNLLFILENTSSIKGKGLEGEFVYGWDNKDLVLLPVDSVDYKKHIEFSKAVDSKTKFTSKNMILGATYYSKGCPEMIYCGYSDYFDWNCVRTGKKHWFYYKDKWTIERFDVFNLTSIIGCANELPVNNFAELMDKLQKNEMFNPPTERIKKVMSFDEFVEKQEKNQNKDTYPFLYTRSKYDTIKCSIKKNSSGRYDISAKDYFYSYLDTAVSLEDCYKKINTVYYEEIRKNNNVSQ